MSQFASFAISLGGLLALFAVMAAWLFRQSNAPLWLKIIVPSLAVTAACAAPYQAGKMLGFPVWAAESELPAKAELIAFLAHDGTQTVVLWLRSGDEPRAFETKLSPALKKTLREAQEAMGRGQVVHLAQKAERQPRGSAGDPLGIGDDSHYVLDASALSSLPPKD